MNSNNCSTKITALALTLGLSMSACGLEKVSSWKEEVLLQDGRKIYVDRLQKYGGRAEPGQSKRITEHHISFNLPNTEEKISWDSTYDPEILDPDFIPIALHFEKQTPYIVVEPSYCLSFNKWGRPNPPYIFFRFVKGKWEQIKLSEFPNEFKSVNLIVDTVNQKPIFEAQKDSDYIPVEVIQKLNSRLTQPQYKAISRSEIEHVGPEGCPVMVKNNDGWGAVGNAQVPTLVAPK